MRVDWAGARGIPQRAPRPERTLPRRAAPAGLEASMAGKADLVNSIVDSVEYIQKIPVQDGWKEDAAALAPAGTLPLDPLGGA